MLFGWGWYFFSAVLLGAFFGFSIVIVGKFSSVDRKILKRLGGVSIIIPTLVLILINPEIELTFAIKGLLFGLVAILVFGLIDDFCDLSWKTQLSFQVFLVSCLVTFFAFSIDHFVGPFESIIRMDQIVLGIGEVKVSILSFVFILLWVLVVMNAINWADGINGLSGIVGILGGLALLGVSLLKEVNQPAIAILAIIFIGALLGFWWNNFPSGRIEAGTSGSYMIGFFLAITAIMAGTKVATSLIVLIVPLVDFLNVIFERFRSGVSVTKKDKRHLHYKLRAIGWSDSKIVLVYFIFITIMLTISFLADSRNWKLIVMLIEAVVLVIFIKNISGKKDVGKI